MQQSQAQPFSTHAPLWWSTGCHPLLPHLATLLSLCEPPQAWAPGYRARPGPLWVLPPRWALSRKRNEVSLWAQILHTSGALLSVSLVLCWAPGEGRAEGFTPVSEATVCPHPWHPPVQSAFSLPSGARALYVFSVCSPGGGFIYVHVPSHSLKGPDFWLTLKIQEKTVSSHPWCIKDAIPRLSLGWQIKPIR